MPADSVTYVYDLNGRLRLLTFANSDTVEVTYDDMGNRESYDITIAPPFALQAAAQDADAQSTSEVSPDLKPDETVAQAESPAADSNAAQ